MSHTIEEQVEMLKSQEEHFILSARLLEHANVNPTGQLILKQMLLSLCYVLFIYLNEPCDAFFSLTLARHKQMK